MLKSFIDRLKRFGAAREAVAAIEFAFILPIMLTLYIGSQELSMLITVDRRVTVIAGTVGDLVSRADTCLASSTLSDYFAAAQVIIGGLPTTGLAQTISDVTVDSNGHGTVEWSQSYPSDSGTARAVNSTYTFDSGNAMGTLAAGGHVIVAETAYPYKPILGMFFQNTFNLYRVEYYLPRYDGDIQVQSSCDASS
jgi:Flp pilus assembly protein TadG